MDATSRKRWPSAYYVAFIPKSFLIPKNFHNVLTLSLYLSFFIAWVIFATIVFIEDPDNNEIGAMTYHYYQGLLSGKSHLELCYTKGFVPTAKSPSTKGDKNG